MVVCFESRRGKEIFERERERDVYIDLAELSIERECGLWSWL